MSRRMSLMSIALTLVAVPFACPAQNRTFSLPNSVLLFRDYESGLELTSPDGSKTMSLPSDRLKRPLATASLGRDGRTVSWGFPVATDSGKTWKVRCAVAVRSALDTEWRTFGGFSQIHATAMSSDDSRVAFIADEADSSSRGLYVLSIGNGQITKLHKVTAVSVGWAPDSGKLVLGTPGGSTPAEVKVLDIASGTLRLLVQGDSPAWSPSGDWIAYFSHSDQRLSLIRPDGSGNHVLEDVGNRALGYRRFGGQPVWSPDGKQLLLNEYKGDLDSSDVVLFEISTGRLKRLSNNGDDIVGWAAQKN